MQIFISNAKITNYKAYKKDPESELLPVFVYAEEKAFNDVKNWTIAKLKNEFEKLIKMIFKACVYFLSSFYFSPNDSPSKIRKNAF